MKEQNYNEKGRKIKFFCPFMRLYYHKIAIFSRLPIFGFVYYNHVLTYERGNVSGSFV